MSRYRILIFVAATLSAALWAYACGDGVTEPPTPPPDPPRPATVTVTPATTQLTALGDTVQLSAEVRDQDGQVMAGAGVTWTSSATSIATVSGSGLVAAAGNGTATITATAGAVSGSATVTVAQEVSAVVVSPAADTLVEGDTLHLSAEAVDGNGHAVAGAEFEWASSDTQVATADDSGLVTGVAEGEAEITAASSGVTGRAQVTVVAPVPTTVAVTPDSVVFTAIGQTVQLSAEVRDQNGQVMAGAGVTWTSSATSIATVSGSGLVAAAGNGTATITATAGAVSGSATVTVAQEVSAVVVSPAADTLVEGDTLHLSAEAVDGNGHAVAGAEFEWASSDTQVATADDSGLVTGVAEGEAEITAASSGVTGRAQVTVVAPVPTTVAVTPDSVVFTAIGQTVQLSAEVRDQNGQVMAGAGVTWTSSATSIATVSGSGLVAAAGNGTATITATAGAVSGSATVTVAQEVSAVVVSPAADTLVEGDTLHLSAEAVDGNGHAVAGAEFEWASSDTQVATADDSGLVTGVAEGEAEITAASSGVTGRAQVTVVAPVPTTVAVTPDSVVFTAIGQTVQLSAEVRDQNGQVMAGAGVTWTSSATSIATVSGSGLVAAAGNGTATITATAGAVSGSATVTVAQEVSAVVVSPAADTLVEGDTLHLSAEAVDGNGHAVAGAEFEWASSDTQVATADDSGLVTGVAEGEAEITAASSGVTGRAQVTVVAPVPTTVAVTPDSVVFTAIGQTVQLSAEVRDQNGQVMAGAGVTWTSSATSIATVSGSGLVAAAGNGTATITATAGAVSGSATVTVAQEVSAVVVSPAADTLVEGDTLHLSAEAVDGNGHAVAGAEFEWASSDTQVATADDSGLVTGVAEGEAEITAASSGVTGRAQVTVVAPVPTTVAVTPDSVVFTAIGQTVQLSAEVRDQNGQVMADVPVTWASADTTVAVVDSLGLLTATGGGATTVIATAGEAEGEALVTVMQSAGAVIVSPATDTIAVDDTLRLAAEAFDENGHAVEGAEFAWSSSNVPVAMVDGSGLVRGIAEGTATITATAGDARGTAEITVENPDRAALVALYYATDGPNWVNNDNWLTDAPLGDWYGVDTDASGRVVRLDLGGQRDEDSRQWIPHGLTGGIPSELGDLSELTELNLRYNALEGPIPPEFGKLANLTLLTLWRNSLTGPIPPELGNLASLSVLWLSNNDLSGAIPPELGNLVNLRNLGLAGNNLTDNIPSQLGNLASLGQLALGSNDLSGPVPPELGNLTGLWSLALSYNDLTGSIPESFLKLDRLGYFNFGENAGLCAPGTSAFATWLERIENRDEGPYCNASDAGVLELLYQTSDGPEWTNSDGWLGAPALEEWYGVTADSLGRVRTLDLTRNGLTGRLRADLGKLAEMTRLRIGGNALSGRLPSSLSRLSLVELDYADTELCAPAEEPFQAWLNAIASHEGTGTECAALSDREVLEILYNATGGPNWTNSENWLTDAPLSTWSRVSADGEGRVVALSLGFNNLTGSIPAEVGNLSRLEQLLFFGNEELTGSIPPELGNLANLTWLGLSFSSLSGPIPPELGRLSELTEMRMWRTGVEGAIPPELGSLSSLRNLALGENALTGSIPPELGQLTQLETLYLTRNAMTGSVPRELGNLANLELLSLDQNDLAGPIPPELGQLTHLKELGVANNTQMSGVLPGSLTALRALEAFVTTGTGLCAPADAGFLEWLAGIRKRRVAMCDGGEASMAYMTQAVQSREFPVPLVAGEKALLRVFVTAARATAADIPPVRARFYLNGTETHVEDISGKSTPIPTEVTEGNLSKSANAEIPGHVVQPGLEMVIEVDPDGTLDSALGVAKRIPSTGRATVEVQAMPTLDLTLVPFLWAANPDSSILHLASGMAADPENHEMLRDTRTLLPVGVLDVEVHEPVLTDHNKSVSLGALEAIRLMEGGSGHYMAFVSRRRELGASGYARGNRLSASMPLPATIAHELGHNMDLSHAPCGPVAGIDLGFPYPDGSIGAWGYDFRDGGRLVSPGRPDLMSYCDPEWVSDYHFTNALRFRLVDEGASEAAVVAESARSLLLWGGIGTDSVPFLDPAFVVDAPVALPDSAGEYRLIGRTDSGAELFSLSFDMPEVADGDGSSGFAFVLPIESGWEGDLASITLTGPGGRVTLDGNTDRPMAILRNPRNGQVRGILRDLPLPTQAGMDAAGAVAGPVLEVLFSRGIPDAEAWRR